MLSEVEQGFRQKCRQGDADGALRLLERIEDAAVRELVEAIGGPRAMARFLIQRRHILHMDEALSLVDWLRAHLHEAEPMHLLDISTALSAARASEQDAIVRRLEKHLKFLQPPDPTRWSRPFNSARQQTFLDACQQGDIESVRAAIEEDPAIINARNKWGQDGLTLLGIHRSEHGPELVDLLCEADIRKTAMATCTAAFHGAAEVLERLLAHDCPLSGPLDEDALWSVARATRVNDLHVDAFTAVAEQLAAAGADLNAVDRWGTTAWGIAIESARPILERLGAEARERGDVRYQQDSHCSPFIQACIAGQVPEVDPEALDLNEAAAANNIERVAWLLDEVYHHKAVLRSYGPPERPLHMAALIGHVEVTHLLVRYGYSPAEPNMAFIDGSHIGPESSWKRTPIDIAVERGHEALLNVLMNNVDFFQGRRARRK